MKPLFINAAWLAVVLAFPGQASPLGPAPGIGQEVASGVSTTPPAPFPVLTPEDEVANLVREALRAPDRDETWACLDFALSKMIAPAVEGQEPSHRAIRVADSLTCPSGSLRTTASSSSASTTPPGGLQRASSFGRLLNGARQWVIGLFGGWKDLATRKPWIPRGLLILAGIALLWLGRHSVREEFGRRPRKTRETGPGPRLERRGPSIPQDNPKILALALWEGGLPSPEIARRTGLAQDALSVLLMLNEKENPILVSNPPHPSPPNPYASAGAGRK